MSFQGVVRYQSCGRPDNGWKRSGWTSLRFLSTISQFSFPLPIRAQLGKTGGHCLFHFIKLSSEARGNDGSKSAEIINPDPSFLSFIKEDNDQFSLIGRDENWRQIVGKSPVKSL